eukprot:165841_1
MRFASMCTFLICAFNLYWCAMSFTCEPKQKYFVWSLSSNEQAEKINNECEYLECSGDGTFLKWKPDIPDKKQSVSGILTPRENERISSMAIERALTPAGCPEAHKHAGHSKEHEIEIRKCITDFEREESKKLIEPRAPRVFEPLRTKIEIIDKASLTNIGTVSNKIKEFGDDDTDKIKFKTTQWLGMTASFPAKILNEEVFEQHILVRKIKCINDEKDPRYPIHYVTKSSDIKTKTKAIIYQNLNAFWKDPVKNPGSYNHEKVFNIVKNIDELDVTLDNLKSYEGITIFSPDCNDKFFVADQHKGTNPEGDDVTMDFNKYWQIHAMNMNKHFADFLLPASNWNDKKLWFDIYFSPSHVEDYDTYGFRTTFQKQFSDKTMSLIDLLSYDNIVLGQPLPTVPNSHHCQWQFEVDDTIKLIDSSVAGVEGDDINIYKYKLLKCDGLNDDKAPDDDIFLYVSAGNHKHDLYAKKLENILEGALKNIQVFLVEYDYIRLHSYMEARGDFPFEFEYKACLARNGETEPNKELCKQKNIQNFYDYEYTPEFNTNLKRFDFGEFERTLFSATRKNEPYILTDIPQAQNWPLLLMNKRTLHNTDNYKNGPSKNADLYNAIRFNQRNHGMTNAVNKALQRYYFNEKTAPSGMPKTNYLLVIGNNHWKPELMTVDKFSYLTFGLHHLFTDGYKLVGDVTSKKWESKFNLAPYVAEDKLAGSNVYIHNYDHGIRYNKYHYIHHYYKPLVSTSLIVAALILAALIFAFVWFVLSFVVGLLFGIVSFEFIKRNNSKDGNIHDNHHHNSMA